jgi:hypothetical protein
MLDTYIKNRGYTKTIIQNNNTNENNEIKWDADYDGNKAFIDMNINRNGYNDHYFFSLNNEDLASLLNIDSEDFPLEKRLRRDFKKKQFKYNTQFYQIELEPTKHSTHISSPLINEEYIEIPKSVYSVTKRHYKRHPKTHKSNTDYKRHKKVISKGKSKTSRTSLYTI